MNYYLSKLSRDMGRQTKNIAPRTMEVLTNRPWKGNVRELANFIERAVVLSQGEELTVPAEEFLAPDSPSPLRSQRSTRQNAL